MRERIAKLIYRNLPTGSAYEKKENIADQILTLFREEIKKVENPYHEHNMPGYSNKYPEFAVFEDARQKILKTLEGK